MCKDTDNDMSKQLHSNLHVGFLVLFIYVGLGIKLSTKTSC